MKILLKDFLAEKAGGGGGGGGRGECFKSLRCIFYTDMRAIVFFWNIVNSQYLKVEVHLSQLIFQNIFSYPRSFTLRYQQFEIR